MSILVYIYKHNELGQKDVNALFMTTYVIFGIMFYKHDEVSKKVGASEMLLPDVSIGIAFI